MTAPKHTLTAVILDVTQQHAAWHSGGGWFCDQCDQDCGEQRDDLCGCCGLGVVELFDEASGVVS